MAHALSRGCSNHKTHEHRHLLSPGPRGRTEAKVEVWANWKGDDNVHAPHDLNTHKKRHAPLGHRAWSPSYEGNGGKTSPGQDSRKGLLVLLCHCLDVTLSEAFLLGLSFLTCCTGRPTQVPKFPPAQDCLRAPSTLQIPFGLVFQPTGNKLACWPQLSWARSLRQVAQVVTPLLSSNRQ